MNPITKAMSEIRFNIPMEILNIAFNNNNSIVSLDEQIMAKVLRPRVLVDCNLVGGVEKLVSLSNAVVKFMNGYSAVYTISKSALDDRPIVSILSYLPGVLNQSSLYAQNYGDGNAVLAAGSRVMAGYSSDAPVPTTDMELLGDNIVLIKYRQFPNVPGMLRLVLANTTNMENINPRSYLVFSALCVLAVKAFIYNTLYIQLNKAYLYGGSELGNVQEYVDGLSDSSELYSDFLETKWRKVSFMNDDESYSRFLRSMISPGL